MRVLSCFDGMSNGQIALERAGIKVDKYYASEIDPHAIKVTQHNYPDTIQLGSITDWKSWNIEKLDSNNKKNENTCMFDDHAFITFNSGVEQPADKGILLKDIIEDGIGPDKKPNFDYKSQSNSYFELDEKMQSLSAGTHGYCNGYIKCGAFRGRNPENPKSRESGLETKQMLEIREDEKTNCLTSVQKDNVIVRDAIYNNRPERIYYDKCPTLRSERHGLEISKGCKQIGVTGESGHESRNRVYSIEGKSPTLETCTGGGHEKKISTDNITWRKLTPIECCRLQTVPENYFKDENDNNIISNSQQYKCLGNGWTVDVISHILRGIL